MTNDLPKRRSITLTTLSDRKVIIVEQNNEAFKAIAAAVNKELADMQAAPCTVIHCRTNEDAVKQIENHGMVTAIIVGHPHDTIDSGGYMELIRELRAQSETSPIITFNNTVETPAAKGAGANFVIREGDYDSLGGAFLEAMRHPPARNL